MLDLTGGIDGDNKSFIFFIVIQWIQNITYIKVM